MLLLLLWLPFISFFLSAVFGRFLGRGVLFLSIGNIFLTFFFACYLFTCLYVQKFVAFLQVGLWVRVDILEINWELLLDSVNLILICVVTGISALVHLYSAEYMQEDPHLQRFMSYLSLFTFFMLILITGSNFIQMFVGWEGVGLSSYLLINFWFTRIQANKAAIKAMLFNRVADLLLLLALCLIFEVFETFDYTIIFCLIEIIAQTSIFIGNIKFIAIDLICLFLFLGAMGKSAQIGFHNWLPDAMEGPTPVSALIHAATMVTAGVFLLVRCSALFEQSISVLTFIAFIGALTALWGSSVGLFSHDLKRVIAFSTCSQLGYMMLACGLEAYTTALFHLTSHACFKALLFLAAGSIIHSAFDEQDTRKLGGLIRYIPLTYICFLVGSLNLMGVPFLGGFFTKDMILEQAASTYTTIGLFCYMLGLFSVFLTAAYSTRIFFLVFLAIPSMNKYLISQIMENGFCIKIPLLLLSFSSILVGGIAADLFYGLGTNFFGDSIFNQRDSFNNGDFEFINIFLKNLPLIFMFCGSGFSFLLYLVFKKHLINIKCFSLFSFVYAFFNKKWYMDRIVNQCITLPLLLWSQQYAYTRVDRGLLELCGPTTFSYLVKVSSKPFFNLFSLFFLKHYY